MRTSCQLRERSMPHPHTKQRRRREPDVIHPQGRRWRQRACQAVLILTMVGAVLLLWAQPAAAKVSITEYKVPSPGIPQGIAAGSDGALWFTEFYDDQIGRISTTGAISLYTINTLTNTPAYIAAGPDGALWFTFPNNTTPYNSGQIVRITTSGAVTTYTIPKVSYPWDITGGSDGNLWFTDGVQVAIWQITPHGQFTEFPAPGGISGYPYEITAGPDGNLWFTTRSTQLGKMTSSGQFTLYTLAASDGTTDDITAGPDGALWFTLDDTGKIGRITTTGKITEYPLSNPHGDYIFLSGIAAGPDGNLWFTYEDYTSKSSKIGRITTSGAITLWPTPTANSNPTDITAGPDGALWFTEAAGKIGRITTG